MNYCIPINSKHDKKDMIPELKARGIKFYVIENTLLIIHPTYNFIGLFPWINKYERR